MNTLRNVIIVNDFAYINGGQTKVAIDTANLLSNAGFDVTYFAACGPIDPSLEQSCAKIVCLDQNDILSEPNRLKGAVRGIWNGHAASELQRLLSSFDPKTSIVHWHGYAKALSPSVGPVITKSGIPHVYTMHEYFLACPNGGFYDYQKNEICTRKALGASCLTTNCDVRHPAHKAWRVARQIATRVPGGLPRNLKNIIYISETQIGALRRYIPNEVNLYHVPNPVSVSERPLVDITKNDIFLFVGRLNPEKGGLFFARAAKQAGVKAVFVGDGQEREAIKNANPDAIITGWQAPNEVDEWYNKARCLVFPSLWYECQPLVPMEALARGIPVISGKWSAASEVVENDVNGILVDNKSVDSWAEAIKKIRTDVSAYRNVENSIKQQNYLDNLITVYNNVRDTN